jgi:hypothetical protein
MPVLAHDYVLGRAKKEFPVTSLAWGLDAHSHFVEVDLNKARLNGKAIARNMARWVAEHRGVRKAAGKNKFKYEIENTPKKVRITFTKVK